MELGSVVAEVSCYPDVQRNALVAILVSGGTRDGILCELTQGEIEGLAEVLRKELRVKRFFGLPIGTREVYVQYESHAS